MGTLHMIPSDQMIFSVYTQSIGYVLRWLERDNPNEPETDLLRIWVVEARNTGLLEGDARTGYRLGDIGRRWLEERGL